MQQNPCAKKFPGKKQNMQVKHAGESGENGDSTKLREGVEPFLLS
jgi:hypothetical protein